MKNLIILSKNMRQITKEEAVTIFENKLYENWTLEEIVKFQLFQERLAMPFDVYHKAVEIVLGRPVFTHEFGLNIDGLRKEFLGEKEAPTFEEIVSLFPKDKLIFTK